MDKIEILNMIPQFLDFYMKASHGEIDEEKRWELWKEHYNFAAVPPGDEGTNLARELLRNAWTKYEKKLEYIINWEPKLQIIETYLKEVKKLLNCKENICITVVYFVGAFDDNPFVAPTYDGGVALCLPIENGTAESQIMIAHELTHIVHAKTANLSNSWQCSIGSTVLQEGLATQVSKYLVPGHKVESYIEHYEGWFSSCQSVRDEILTGIYPYLHKSSPEYSMKFTFGKGTTNHYREAYFAGWEIVGILLENGKSFREIASIQENEIPAFLEFLYKETSVCK
ncbi:DUF2268 domain-containing putative Zn-dependent protease [Bacillus cereus group sp. MYBK79-1]|uniref:DUF2268 domain-containing putative Zn-dependent protease n=1 Tax=unclassified Bacillus cereus group TaxID=2750818 RepID=UPI003F78D23B